MCSTSALTYHQGKKENKKPKPFMYFVINSTYLPPTNWFSANKFFHLNLRPECEARGLLIEVEKPRCYNLQYGPRNKVINISSKILYFSMSAYTQAWACVVQFNSIPNNLMAKFMESNSAKMSNLMTLISVWSHHSKPRNFQLTSLHFPFLQVGLEQ